MSPGVTSRNLARILTAVVGLVLAAVPARAQVGPPAPPPDVAAFLQVVAEYRSGQHALAVMHIRSWDDSRLEVMARSLLIHLAGVVRTCPELPEHVPSAAVDAGVLLHTDAAFASLADGLPGDASRQFDAAERLLAWRLRRESDRAGADRAARQTDRAERERAACHAPAPLPERDWLTAVSLLCLRYWALDTAAWFGARLDKVAPGDVDAIFAAGAVADAQATNDAQFYLPPPVWRLWAPFRYEIEQQRYQQSLRDIKRYRERAAENYAQALAAAPDREDIRLRLAWTRFLLRQRRDVRTDLERVARRASSEGDRYLAALFLGRVDEAQDRPVDAARWYAEAAGRWPGAHVARTALAHALDAAGEVDRAREVLTENILVPRDPVDDPWTAYPHGPYPIGVALLNRLRTEVTVR